MRPRFIPNHGQPGDPSLWALLTLAAWTAAMVAVTLRSDIRRRLLPLKPLPLHLRAHAHLAHLRRQIGF